MRRKKCLPCSATETGRYDERTGSRPGQLRTLRLGVFGTVRDLVSMADETARVIGRGRILACRWYTCLVCTTVGRAIRHSRFPSRKVPGCGRSRAAFPNGLLVYVLVTRAPPSSKSALSRVVSGEGEMVQETARSVPFCTILFHWFGTPLAMRITCRRGLCPAIPALAIGDGRRAPMRGLSIRNRRLLFHGSPPLTRPSADLSPGGEVVKTKDPRNNNFTSRKR